MFREHMVTSYDRNAGIARSDLCWMSLSMCHWNSKQMSKQLEHSPIALSPGTPTQCEALHAVDIYYGKISQFSKHVENRYEEENQHSM